CSIVEIRIAPVTAVHDPHSVVCRSDHTTEVGITSEPSHTRAKCCARVYNSESDRGASRRRDLSFAINVVPDLTISASRIRDGTDSSIIPSRIFADMVFLRRAELIRRTVSPPISTIDDIRPPESCSMSSRLKVEIVSMPFMLHHETTSRS